MTGNLSQLWSGPYPSYPLSRLRNGAYPGLVFLFSSRISPFKSLISQILPWFKPHPAFHILLPAKPMLAPLISDHKQSRWFTVLSLCLNSIKFFFLFTWRWYSEGNDAELKPLQSFSFVLCAVSTPIWFRARVSSGRLITTVFTS